MQLRCDANQVSRAVGSLGPTAERSDGLAAVEHEGVTDRECGVVGAEVGDGCGDLVGASHSSDRFLRPPTRRVVR